MQYARGEEVYVPVGQADRLTRYVGVDDNTPKLAQLGTVDWARTREKARQAPKKLRAPNCWRFMPNENYNRFCLSARQRLAT